MHNQRFGFCLAVDEEPVCEHRGLPPILNRFNRELMVHVANYAPDRVFVHAGVVGWRGRALVLPGTSFVGKTTLVAELVRAGASYYSDEYAVLDEHGHVYPYSRHLQMRQFGGRRQSAVAVQDLGGSAGVAPLPVGKLVFTKYKRRGHWQPEPLSPGTAVLEMLRHTIPVQRTPARVMATLVKMIEQATAAYTERGEAFEVVQDLLATMSREERPI